MTYVLFLTNVMKYFNIYYMKILKYKMFLEKSNVYNYGCVMLYLDIKDWSSITSIIDINDIYSPDDTYGIEDEPHLTLLYGLHKEVKDEDIKKIVDTINKKDIEIVGEGIDIFENKDYDVVKISVKSDYLNELNKEFSKLPYTTDYPDYKPHITICYVKSGTGKKYIDKDFKQKFESDNVVYSKSNGKKITFKLK
jgi:2'-5' RNA ligase